MAKVKYALIGFGGIAENRVAKEGYACDKNRFSESFLFKSHLKIRTFC